MNWVKTVKQLHKFLRKQEIQAFVNRREDYANIPCEKIRQFCVGNSRARYNIYPPAFSIYTWNAGESAADLYTSYHMAKFLLSKCSHVKRVILVYAFYDRGYTLNKSNNKKLSTVFSYFFPWIPWRSVPCILHLALITKLWLNRRMKPSRSPSPYGIDHPKGYTQDTAYLVKANVKQAVKYGSEPLCFLKELKSLCKSYNAELCICIPPERTDYRSLLKEKIDSGQLLQDDLSNLHLPVVDTRNWMEDSFFGDGYHLTEEGAVEFSRRLNTFLEQKKNEDCAFRS